MLVFGQDNLGEVKVDDEGKAFCIFAGRIRQQQENRFNLMKANILASKLAEDGSPVTKETVLAAIRNLNDRAVTKFGQDVQVTTLRSADPKHHDKYWGGRGSVQKTRACPWRRLGPWRQLGRGHGCGQRGLRLRNG